VKYIKVPQPGAPLTPRENDVVRLIAEGLSNKLIAVKLELSEHTVKFHVNNVCKKLGNGKRVLAAVAYVKKTMAPA